MQLAADFMIMKRAQTTEKSSPRGTEKNLTLQNVKHASFLFIIFMRLRLSEYNIFNKIQQHSSSVCSSMPSRSFAANLQLYNSTIVEPIQKQ